MRGALAKGWCSTNVRKVIVELDVDLGQESSTTQHVPAFFDVDDDIRTVSQTFADTYLLGDVGANKIAAAMQQVLVDFPSTSSRANA